MMDRIYQDQIAHDTVLAVQCMAQEIGARSTSPHVLMRPNLSIDGDNWCALYGDNLQDGVAGFGNSPADAMADFDKNWNAELTENNPEADR